MIKIIFLIYYKKETFNLISQPIIRMMVEIIKEKHTCQQKIKMKWLHGKKEWKEKSWLSDVVRDD